MKRLVGFATYFGCLCMQSVGAQAVTYTSFDPGDTFDSIHQGITIARSSNPPGGRQIAAFQFTAGVSGALHGIRVPTRYGAGNPDVSISLFTDLSDHLGTPLKTWLISSPNSSFHIDSVTSADPTILVTASAKYWVLLSSPGDGIHFWGKSIRPGLMFSALSFDGGGVFHYGNTDTFSAFEVSVNTVRVSGRARLNGYMGITGGKLLEVQIWQHDTLVESLNGNYGVDGSFGFSPYSDGAVDLKFRFHTGLWKSIPVTLGTTPIDDLDVAMGNGDCDHDNEVTLADYAVLSSVFGLADGDEGYDSDADLNGDDEVNLGDYSILAANFGAVGD